MNKKEKSKPKSTGTAREELLKECGQCQKPCAWSVDECPHLHEDIQKEDDVYYESTLGWNPFKIGSKK